MTATGGRFVHRVHFVVPLRDTASKRSADLTPREAAARLVVSPRTDLDFSGPFGGIVRVSTGEIFFRCDTAYYDVGAGTFAAYTFGAQRPARVPLGSRSRLGADTRGGGARRPRGPPIRSERGSQIVMLVLTMLQIALMWRQNDRPITRVEINTYMYHLDGQLQRTRSGATSCTPSSSRSAD